MKYKDQLRLSLGIICYKSQREIEMKNVMVYPVMLRSEEVDFLRRVLGGLALIRDYDESEEPLLEKIKDRLSKVKP